MEVLLSGHLKLREESDKNNLINLFRSTVKLKGLGVQVRNWGIGSTPSCSHEGEEMKRLTEIHPGNYVFYDLQQQMVCLSVTHCFPTFNGQEL